MKIRSVQSVSVSCSIMEPFEIASSIPNIIKKRVNRSWNYSRYYTIAMQAAT